MARLARLIDGLNPGLHLGQMSSGAFTARLRMRCARQRCRAERGKQVSIALITPGGAVGDNQERIAEAACPHVLEEGGDGLGVFPGARHQVQQNALPGLREAPGGHDRFAPLAGADALGDPVDEEVDDLVLAQVARGELLVVPPELLAEFGDRGPGEQQPAVVGAEGVSTSGTDRPRASISTASSSSASVRPLAWPRISERNGSSPPATCGAENAISPSAVFSRAIRWPLR